MRLQYKTYVVVAAMAYVGVWPNGVAVAADTDMSPLVSLVAAANKTNRELLESLSLDYTVTFNTPSEGEAAITQNPSVIIKKGQYAFATGDKIFSKEVFVGEGQEGVGIHYVRNGNSLRTRMAGATPVVQLGTQDHCNLRPGTPDPWGIVDTGVASMLDKLGEKFKLVSIAQAQEDGHECIKAVIGVVSSMPDGSSITVPHTVWYRKDYGYLPWKFSYEWMGGGDWQGVIVGHGEVKAMGQFDVHGSTVFIPMSFYEERSRDGKVEYSRLHEVDVKTVQINPDLPEELFVVQIQPGDQVINQDLGIELRGPSGRDILIDKAMDKTIKNIGRDSEVVLSNAKASGDTTVPSRQVGINPDGVAEQAEDGPVQGQNHWWLSVVGVAVLACASGMIVHWRKKRTR